MNLHAGPQETLHQIVSQHTQPFAALHGLLTLAIPDALNRLLGPMDGIPSLVPENGDVPGHVMSMNVRHYVAYRGRTSTALGPGDSSLWFLEPRQGYGVRMIDGRGTVIRLRKVPLSAKDEVQTRIDAPPATIEEIDDWISRERPQSAKFDLAVLWDWSPETRQVKDVCLAAVFGLDSTDVQILAQVALPPAEFPIDTAPPLIQDRSLRPLRPADDLQDDFDDVNWGEEQGMGNA